MDSNKRINDAIQVLVEEGEKSYVPESINKISKWAKIGMAISGVTDFSDKMWDMIYAIAEDWNFHAVCAMIDFVFRDKESHHIFETLKVVLPSYLNKEIECRSYDGFGHFTLKKIKVTVNIEEI